MTAILQDLRSAMRTLRRRRGFTVTMIAVLGLGLGAATSMYSLVDGVLLRPLPYEEPDRLVTIWYTLPHWRDDPQLSDGWDTQGLPYDSYVRLRDRTRALSDVAIYRVRPRIVEQGDVRQEMPVGDASSSLLSVLRLQMIAGRWFLPSEEGPGAPRLAVLSESFWRESMGADADVIGTSVRIGTDLFEVIGVAPSRAALTPLQASGAREPAALWIAPGATGERLHPQSYEFEAIARLAPGITHAQADAEVTPILRGDMDPALRGARVLSRHEAETGSVAHPLFLLLAAVGLLLAVACTNAAALLLGEATGRESEVATRAALGAQRHRIIRELLFESVLLALSAGVAGLVLATAGSALLAQLAPPGMTRAADVAVDMRVMIFGLGAALVCGLAFGVAPAVSLTRAGMAGLTRGSRATRRLRLQPLLIAAQMTLCTLLLVSAALLVRSLRSEAGVDPGFRSADLLTFRIDASVATDGDDPVPVMQRLRERIEAVDGVSAVTFTRSLPYSGRRQSWTVRRSDAAEADRLHARRHSVLPGYFDVAGMQLLAGRSLTDSDDAGAAAVALVNETMARTLWPGVSPIGRSLETPNGPLTIIGVVNDTRDEGLDMTPQPTFYTSYLQRPDDVMSVIVRMTQGSVSTAERVLATVRSVDPQLTAAEPARLDDLIDATMAADRYRAIILSLFASTAALLAVCGIAGVTAREVGSRTREIGIRSALGAGPLRIVGTFSTANLPAACAGVAAGLAAAFASGRIIETYLFGITAADPASYASVAALLTISSFIAALAVSRRAATVDPADVLRR